MAMTAPPPDIRVLLIEDNPGDVELVREALSDNGIPFHVDIANRLADGIEWVGRQDHDLVLLDLGLPDSTGTDTFRRLHEVNRELPIVILTVLGDEDQAVRAVAEGAQDFLVKDELQGTRLPRAVRYAIERHRMLRSLQQLADELRTMLTHAAHDLQTPLATVAGLAETLELARDRIADEHFTATLASVRRQALRVSDMVNDLLDLAKIGQGFDPEPVNVRRAVHNALRDAPPPSDVGLVVSLDATPRVGAAPGRVERLLTNLLTNAYRYGGGTVAVATSGDADQVRLHVADDGPGVPEELHDTLFEPFTAGRNRSDDSTGLGLSIVHHLARSLGGTVGYDRDPGLGGARFTVQLPVWPATSD